jgi:hypothetical protein
MTRKGPSTGIVPRATAGADPFTSKDVENALLELVTALARQAARRDYERALAAASDDTPCAAP